jgi:hypothetical protein
LKRIEGKQLNDVVHILKLKLQEQEITSMDISQLFFGAYCPEDEITLKDLKVKFESLGVKAPKSQQLARYLVEPKVGGEVVFSDNSYCTQKEVIDHLYVLIGPYKIYSEGSGEDYANDAKMQAAAVNKFGRLKQTLSDALACEDYEDTGILELTQVREAI